MLNPLARWHAFFKCNHCFMHDELVKLVSLHYKDGSRVSKHHVVEVWSRHKAWQGCQHQKFFPDVIRWLGSCAHHVQGLSFRFL